MKVFLTGATGYIGNRLAHKLVEQDYEVHALIRDLRSEKIPKHNKIRLFKGDLCDENSVQAAMADCDYVFHTAAFTDLKCNKINQFYKTNVQGTTNVLKTAYLHNVKKMVYTSTLAVYGPALEHVPITEQQPRLQSYSNDYELTKKMAEEAVMKYSDKGLSCTILNLTRVYGPGLKTFSNGVNALISKIMKDKVLFVPSKLNIEANYVYIEDVLNAELLALQKGKSGEKYIIGGENVNYHQLFSKIINKTQSKIAIMEINYELLKGLISCITTLDRLLGLSPPLTTKVLDSLFTNRSASSQKAISELDYEITPLDKGLEYTINHLIGVL